MADLAPSSPRPIVLVHGAWMGAAVWDKVAADLRVHTLRDNAVSYALQKSMPAGAGGAAGVAELDTSHSPMLSQPEALADLIAAAAR